MRTVTTSGHPRGHSPLGGNSPRCARLAFIVLASLASIPAWAAPSTKVGVIHFDQLFNNTQTAKLDRAELDQLTAAKQTEVDQRKSQLARARAELASAAPRMDAVAHSRREAELDAEAAGLKKLFEDAQATVNARERELSNRVVADARQLAPELAREKGISVVLGAAEALLWSAPTVVQVDLTAEIARALDHRLAEIRH
jgi:Skp family chaperone for outer membrane proteins